jgi:hypothetical protein
VPMLYEMRPSRGRDQLGSGGRSFGLVALDIDGFYAGMTMLISTFIGSESRAITHYNGHARVATVFEVSPAFSEQPSSSVRPSGWGESFRRQNQGTDCQVRRGLGVTTRGDVRGTHAVAGLG